MFEKLLAVAAVVCCLSGAALAQGLAIKSDQPVTLAKTRQLLVHSPSLNRDFVVRITQPAGAPLAAGDKAAAMYVLDGNIYFGMASDTLALMALEQETWPAYVIAVGYDAGVNVMNQRAEDFLYTPVVEDGKSDGGGGEAFAKFILDELKPYVEATLQVDPQRSFIGGHSYGGLFVSNLIARRPDAFAGYLIGSPSVWADASLVEAVGKVKGAGRPIYVSVGEKEVFDTINMVTDAARLQASLKAAGFNVTYREHTEQTHVMEPNIMFAEGLRLLLAKPKS